MGRCPYCGSLMTQDSMPKAIRARLMRGIASMDDLREAARVAQPKARDKQIYNALGSLVRRGEIKRLPSGFYKSLEN